MHKVKVKRVSSVSLPVTVKLWLGCVLDMTMTTRSFLNTWKINHEYNRGQPFVLLGSETCFAPSTREAGWDAKHTFRGRHYEKRGAVTMLVYVG